MDLASSSRRNGEAIVGKEDTERIAAQSLSALLQQLRFYGVQGLEKSSVQGWYVLR